MYLVFDVGGTFIKYALMDQKGKIYDKETIEWYRSFYHL